MGHVGTEIQNDNIDRTCLSLSIALPPCFEGLCGRSKEASRARACCLGQLGAPPGMTSWLVGSGPRILGMSFSYKMIQIPLQLPWDRSARLRNRNW